MAQIQNLNESWDGIHTGDEIEAFLKSELRKANDKVGGIKVNGILQEQLMMNLMRKATMCLRTQPLLLR